MSEKCQNPILDSDIYQVGTGDNCKCYSITKKVVNNIHTLGVNPKTYFLTEYGLYEVLM
ncbi:hypothetical protein [Bacillus thuringiensis]|uniref:hypothetical protein n=1 Tax=Bacillus thuringiensis TaxID=1428 RepID=UPI003B9845AB|nr:Bro-N domain-containing protein [Bacillus cereus]